MSVGKVLITGGDGYVGLRSARRLLEGGNREVIVWMHARGADEMRAKVAHVERALEPYRGRYVCCSGDLEREDALASVDPGSVGAIVHAAAVTRFNVERDLAQRVNVDGTRRVLAFARRCPALETFDLVSSIYSAGLRSGVVDERRHDDSAGFCNHYEWSKWAAEELIFSEFADLPWRIVRVATAIADDDSGTVTQHNSFHNTLKLVYYGLISILPGDPKVTPYFVTGATIADAMLALSRSSARRSVHHVAHAKGTGGTLGDLLDIAFAVFEEDDAFRARRILKPLTCDVESFDLLLQGMDGIGGAVVRQSLSSVSPFARQLFLDKDVENARFVDLFPDYRPPDMSRLIESTCRYLVRTRFGRESVRAAS